MHQITLLAWPVHRPKLLNKVSIRVQEALEKAYHHNR